MVALNIRPRCLDEESRIKYIKNNLGVLVNEPQWNLNICGIRSIFEGLTEYFLLFDQLRCPLQVRPSKNNSIDIQFHTVNTQKRIQQHDTRIKMI